MPIYYFKSGKYFARRIKNLPCIIRTLLSGLQGIKILVDSGSTNNYIRSNLQIGTRVKSNHNAIARTLHGHSEIRFKQEIRLLRQNFDFFEIDELLDFDMI